MEVRIEGRIKFANIVYGPKFDIDGAALTIRADLQPTLVDPTPGVRWDRDDPREGASTVMTVHDGKGTPEPPPAEEVAAPSPKSRSSKAKPTEENTT
jgi:hypothetical protein